MSVTSSQDTATFFFPPCQTNKVGANLLARAQVRAAAVEYPAPAFSEPRWGAAVVRAAPQVHETAAARGRLDEETTRRLLKVAWRAAGVQPIRA